MSSQSATQSRPPLSNRADRQIDAAEASNVRMAKTPKEGFGEKLREEVTFDSLRGVEAVPWEEAT